MRRVLHFLKKELIELRADPRLFGVVIMAPIIQLTVLGYAATTDVKDVPLLVVDGDRSMESRRLIERKIPVDMDALADPAQPFAAMLKGKP